MSALPQTCLPAGRGAKPQSFKKLRFSLFLRDLVANKNHLFTDLFQHIVEKVFRSLPFGRQAQSLQFY